MSLALSNTSSLERLRLYVVGVIAGLLALQRLRALEVPGMEPLEGPWIETFLGKWRGEKAQIAGAITARDADRDRDEETSATVRVFDVQWDATVRRLSGLAFLVSGKKEEAEPYALLFGGVKARDLTSLGPAKAGVAGLELVAKVNAWGGAELTPLAAALDKQTKALVAADEEDAVAEAQAATHEVERVKTLRRLERLRDETEAQLLVKFPGRKDLVKSVLAFEADRRAKKQDEDAPTPTA